MLQLASKGQHTSVDMLVKDIYGGSYGSLGLTGDLIASSFGKSATADKGDTGEGPSVRTSRQNTQVQDKKYLTAGHKGGSAHC